LAAGAFDSLQANIAAVVLGELPLSLPHFGLKSHVDSDLRIVKIGIRARRQNG